MSFLNFMGSGRKPAAPARPVATTGKADTAHIHAHITNPSRKPSVDSLASVFQDRRQPSRALTDMPPSHTGLPRPPSRSSTSVLETESSTARHPRGTAVYTNALTSASSSLSSLIDSVENVHFSSPTLRKSNSHPHSGVPPSNKASSSLEQEWSEVENDSSDDDDFDGPNSGGPVPKMADKRKNQGSPSLHEPAIMVEDEQQQIQKLTEELSATNQRLANVSQEHHILRQRLQRSEAENSQQADRLKATMEASDAVSRANSQAHAMAIEEREQEIKNLQKSIAVMELMVEMKDAEIKTLSHENGTLNQDLASRDDLNGKREELFNELKNEADGAVRELWSYKERSEAALDAERKERNKLKSQVDELSTRLEDLEIQLKERCEEVKRLRMSRKSVSEALLRAKSIVDEKDKALLSTKSIVDEKDKALNDLTKQCNDLNKQREKYQEQLTTLETEIEEVRNSGQRLIAKTKEDQRLDVTAGNNRIRALELDISGYVSTILQLRNLLEAAEGAAEGRAREINDLRTRLTTLEEDLDAKDEELNHVSTARCSREDSINNFHEAMAEVEAKNKASVMKLEESIAALQNTIHTSEATIHELQRDIDAQRQRHEARAKEDQTRISELENTVSTTRDKYREMRSRYEASEQSRRMMLDQLARREEENRNHDSSLNFNLSSSIIRDPAQPNADQVYTLLNNLNYEIFQTAALFADSLCTTERSSSSTHNNTINELLDEESTSLLGPYLLSLVRSQSTTPLDTYDPYPLQTAIQATLVCCATRIMTAWYPGHWDQSDFLAATYARIREAEGIPASDTWKTMTRARLRPTTSTVLRVVDFLEECLSTIFRYAGWSTANQNSSILPPNTTQTVDSLLKENREKLSALARHSLRLNVILDNVSPQLEPTLVEPGSIFDHYVMEREDADVRGTRDDDKEEVVATCEIGLRKAAEGGGSSSSNGRRRSVIKPKVILRSAFDT